MNLQQKYFYCYSPVLHKFLHNKNNIPYICAAINEKTNKKFWLYEKTPQLNNLLQEYNNFIK